jgi:hypothetical protein
MSERIFLTYTNASAMPYQGSVLGQDQQRLRQLPVLQIAPVFRHFSQLIR